MMFGFDDRFAMFDMTPVDNQFIQEYLPSAKGDFVRVYLYGLMRCYHPEEDMTPERMSHELNMSEEDVLAAYRYWERRGLVRRVSDQPLSYRYINLKQRSLTGETDPDPEYERFAESLFGVFDNGRRLHGSEIQTCYEWIEDLKLPPEAVVMLLKHMAKTKGKNFSIRSAEQMATHMAEENVRTVEDAEAFLSRDQEIYDGTKAVLRRLGKRYLPSEDQMALYRKWTREWGFTPEAVEKACAATAKGSPTMGYLDGILSGLRGKSGEKIGGDQVDAAQRKRERLRELLSALGSGYQVTEENLSLYTEMESLYPQEILLLAARECARSGGSPEDVMKLLRSWKDKGLNGLGEVEEYIREFRAQGEILRDLREIWGLKRPMGTKAREMLNAWEKELGYGKEMILFTAEYASGMNQPMAYLDKVLRSYAEKGVRTIEEARREHKEHTGQAVPVPGGKTGVKTVIAQQYEQRDYADVQESLEDMVARLEGGGTSDA